MEDIGWRNKRFCNASFLSCHEGKDGQLQDEGTVCQVDKKHDTYECSSSRMEYRGFFHDFARTLLPPLQNSREEMRLKRQVPTFLDRLPFSLLYKALQTLL